MKKFVIAALTLGLLAVHVEAAPLAPGKPAGIAAAQDGRETFYVITSGVLLLTGFSLLIASDHSNEAQTSFSVNNASTVTSTSTS